MNMVAGGKPLSNLLPKWHREIGNITLDAIGVIDAGLNTVGVWVKNGDNNSFKRGMVWYVRQGRLVGCLCYNIMDCRLDVASRLISEAWGMDRMEEAVNLMIH